MYRSVTIAALLLSSGLVLTSGLAIAAEGLDWAYPVTPKPEPLDNLKLKQVPDSTRAYTQAQIDDPFEPPDWFPDEHPPMPKIVARGDKPGVRACAQCHLPSGDGHPESSSLAGLPVPYILRQMEAFKNGGRVGVRATVMIAIAKAISEPDAREAAEYFSGLKPGWTKVVETDSVPKSYVGAGGMRFAEAGGEMEPIGNRIIVLPEDEARAKMRDPHSGFIDYVPNGSIAKGEALAATGGEGRTIPCAICHGPTLQGLGEVPPITGRPPTYIVRQLNDMQTGARSGISTALMKAVVEKLTAEDMIALAAYLGSREP
jgi:cytochrome c553